ncbi:LuxR family transcriptional regulator [Gordonia sp. PP30]|uniref:LuxR C-terminal-related transcriptional regulator n=1 Tax=Gordonia sp. PP30 TaxID=2935861 RepID=UPI002000405D|nr:LuxR C-terminal-related transcriptional regulator [Gordonia sp. PP30]UQE75020.1 LuxR family transcriptional regulator [Gordonia sp. PP30]
MTGAGTRRAVGVWSANGWEREAIAAWIEGLGYSTEIVEPGTASADLPEVVVLSGRDRSLAQRIAWIPVARTVVLGGVFDATVMRTAHHVPDGPDVADRLRALLCELLGTGGTRIQLSAREREILTTYVLGATVEEAAAEHFVATSTVRTHYRRVTARYVAAGRPVANKAQLLLRLIADGWIRLNDVVPPAGPAVVPVEPAPDAGAA